MIARDFPLILALIYMGLVLFGIGYNALVALAERKKLTEGYMSDIVALGVLITMVPFAVLPGTYKAWQVIFMVLGGFTASGLPMMIGSRIRHVAARRHEQDSARMAE